MVVHPSVPANSLKEFIELARSKPGVLTYASGGTGSVIQLLAERIKAAPGDFIAQPTLALSTCPTFVDDGLAPRPRPQAPHPQRKTEGVAAGARRPAARRKSHHGGGRSGGMEATVWNGISARRHAGR
jgi:uncharacterized circularly permuted ATP-grasp superfamily protein